jgi:hypothetical protein
VLRGTLLRVTVGHLPDGRIPPKAMWLWHAGPAPLSPDECWRAYLARFDEEHAFKFAKGALGLQPPRSAPQDKPAAGSAWSWRRAPSYCSPARWPLTCAAPGEGAPAPAVRCPLDGSDAGLPTSAPASEPPPVSLNPPGQDRDA